MSRHAREFAAHAGPVAIAFAILAVVVLLATVCSDRIDDTGAAIARLAGRLEQSERHCRRLDAELVSLREHDAALARRIAERDRRIDAMTARIDAVAEATKAELREAISAEAMARDAQTLSLADGDAALMARCDAAEGRLATLESRPTPAPEVRVVQKTVERVAVPIYYPYYVYPVAMPRCR